MAAPKKRTVTRRKKKTEDFELYDFAPGFEAKKTPLVYKGRKLSKTDPGVYRMQNEMGTKNDPLCKFLWGNMLMGAALEEAKLICPSMPEGFVLPDRFIKSAKELGHE